MLLTEVAAQWCPVKEVSLKISLENTGKHTWKHLCWSLFFKVSCSPQACNFIKKETPTQLVIMRTVNFKNKFFYVTPQVAAFVLSFIKPLLCCQNWDTFSIKNTSYEKHQKEFLRIMLFPHQKSHIVTLLKDSKILKSFDRTALQDCIFISKSLRRLLLFVFNSWFKFSFKFTLVIIDR